MDWVLVALAFAVGRRHRYHDPTSTPQDAPGRAGMLFVGICVILGFAGLTTLFLATGVYFVGIPLALVTLLMVGLVRVEISERSGQQVKGKRNSI